MAQRYKPKSGKASTQNITEDESSVTDSSTNKKNSKKKNCLLTILLVFFIGVALVSTYFLLDELFFQTMRNNKNLDEFQSQLESLASDNESDQSELSQSENSNNDNKKDENSEPLVEKRTEYKDAISKLRETYPDLVAWIDVPGTNMQLPVVDSPSSDNEYYLYKNYKGEYDSHGTIFHDEKSNITSENQILHGHCMIDGTMFASIVEFDNLEIYQNSPIIYYDTYNENSAYKIISVFKTNLLKSQGEIFYYLQSDFMNQSQKMNYIYQVMNRSFIDTGVDVNPNDTFLTLSTCSYEFDHFRTVVVARKVRPDEDETVDTSKATLRDDVLVPQIWYDTYGGSAPKLPDTFEEARENGLTHWWYTDD